MLFKKRCGCLPVDDLVYKFFLLCACLSQVYSCCFNILMAHKVGKECDIVAAFYKILSKAVTEGMGIYNIRIYMIPYGVFFELPGDPS